MANFLKSTYCWSFWVWWSMWAYFRPYGTSRPERMSRAPSGFWWLLASFIALPSRARTFYILLSILLLMSSTGAPPSPWWLRFLKGVSRFRALWDSGWLSSLISGSFVSAASSSISSCYLLSRIWLSRWMWWIQLSKSFLYLFLVEKFEIWDFELNWFWFDFLTFF